LFEELASDEPLARRLERLRGASGLERDLRLAVVAAFAGEREEADAALWRVRDSADPTRHAAASAQVALVAGDARRAIVAADRAPNDPWAACVAAEALVLLGELDAASASLSRVPPEHVGGRLANALLALRRDAPQRALEQLTPPNPTGLLGARAMRLRAEAWLDVSAGREALRARDELSAAVWRLVRLGAPAELARCYVQMADVETALGGSRSHAATWLARAHPLLSRAGTPADEERLRRAFRRFGRRAIDRLVDADLERVIEGTRSARARAIDLAGAARDLRAADDQSAVIDDELKAQLGRVGDRDEELIASLESALLDREQSGRLVGICRALLVLTDPNVIDTELPRLALGLGADAAALHQPDGARFVVRTSAGSWGDDVAPTDALANAVRSSGTGLVETESGRMALVPIPARDGARVLVLRQRTQRGGRSPREDERLSILGSVASAAYESAHAAAALREAAARDGATLEAIREGILTLDASGRVRSLNTAAAAVLGVLREDLEGRRLEAEPGFAALAEAIARGIDDDAPVRTPKADVLVRTRPYAGGTVATVQELERARQLAHRLVGSEARFAFEDLVGRDAAFRAVLDDARRLALGDVPALITGESGTGKELLAQAIHNASPRASHPFVGVNVAAIPRELLESELFGYEAGAFTGARARGHPGRFELADRGTILLDEIGDMPLEMQAKLLRVLQERTVLRLGGTRPIPVRARLLATTHRDLEQAVKDGSFRLDLFYRLRVVHLRLPPLRARRGDVALLAEHHLATLASRTRQPRLSLAPNVLADLERYAWPGNVRELANLLEGVASLLPRGERTIAETPASIRRALSPTAEPAPARGMAAAEPPPVEPLEVIERRAIERALDASRGNVAKAARALGVARNTLYNKLARYGIKEAPNS
jgi:transcriptional regulator with PAS, ATPase and Fis domain